MYLLPTTAKRGAGMNVVPNREIFEFGPFQLDSQSGELRKNGLAIRIGSREAQVLIALVENAGELVSRNDLRQRLWPNDTFVEFDNGLNNAISRLRGALADTAESPRFVQTVPRQGYRFSAPITRRTARPKPQFKLSGWRRIAVATGVALIVLMLVSSWRHFAQASNSIDSLAILPFAPADPAGTLEAQYIGTALTDAIADRLSRLHNLRLVPENKVSTYAASNSSIRQIADQLNVNAVARGTVQTFDNRFQVTVQLVNSSGATIWSDSFQDELSDFPVLTRSVARGIVRAANLKVSAEDEKVFAPRAPISPDAYEAYQKGLYCLSQQTENARGRALGYLRQAVAVAPNFAQAYAGLANYYLDATSIPPKIAIPGAKSSAMKALGLNSVAPNSHTAMAAFDFYGDWNWAASDEEFRRALALNPGLERTHRLYAALLSSEAHVESAIAQIRQAHDLDPLSIPVYRRAAMIWINVHQYNQAAAQANEMLALNPNSVPGHETLGTAYLFEQKYPQAVAEFEDAAATRSDSAHITALLASAYAQWGKSSLAAQQLDDLRLMSQSRYVPSYWFATFYASAGDNAQALGWLDRAYQEHDPHMVDLKVSPWFDSLRNEPRFTQLLKEMNFPN